MKKVVIVRGIPGAGKSTLVAREFPGAVVCSADHFFMVDGEYRFDPKQLPLAHQSCWRSFLRALEEGSPLIVVDNTSITVSEIAPYVLPAESFGYEVEILTLEVAPEVASARCVHHVPPARVRAMAENLARHTALFPRHWRSRVMSG